MAKHITKRLPQRYLPPSSEEIIKVGTKVPDSETRITVIDEPSFNRALELIASGPVLISTEKRVYRIEDFDQGAEIVSDQLAHMHVTIVQSYQPQPKKPGYLSVTRPAPLISPTLLVRVTNPETFDQALELVEKGPVTIYGKEERYQASTFDELAEILVKLMSWGQTPLVDSRRLEKK
jgi:hypothetical protein